VETKDGRITTAEAVRQLTVEKALQVRLQNEITRKERIPIEDVLDINNRIFQAIAGTLKANVNKLLTQEHLNEMFAALRDAGDRLEAYADLCDPDFPELVLVDRRRRSH
jgi:phage terminase Nu1 subunit (DNA packaging protein)